MDPFKRNYHTDYDLADPELSATLPRRGEHGAPRENGRLEQDPGWRTERWDCAHSPNIVAPQRVIAAVVGMR